VRLLAALDPGGELRVRLDSIEDVAKWLRSSGAVPPVPDAVNGATHGRTAHLRLLVHVLEQVPAWRRSLALVLRSVLRECTALSLFCKTGLPTEPGLVGEALNRMIRPILPAPPDDHELREVVARMFPSAADARWLEGVPSDLLARLGAALRARRSEGTGAWDPLRDAMCDAVALLATRISSLGLSYEIRERAPDVALRKSPFFELPRVCDTFIAAAEGDAEDATACVSAAAACRAVAAECRSTAAVVTKNLEQFGVSVDVVYRIELIGGSLARLETLVQLLLPDQGIEQQRVGANLLGALVVGGLHDQSVLALVRDNMHMLARKIIERVGETGEHYITATRAEYRKMLLSASGGGLLTAGTTALKFLIAWLKLPPFVEGFLASTNYAGSFVLMQLCGFTLATKQPSMTAAALADSLRTADAKRPDELVALVARITRSQLAAAIGNIGMVIPAAIGLDWLARQRTGHSFLGIFDEGAPDYVIHSLNPLHSGTIPYAALTGVLLWLSSVAAGWLENWATFQRLPEAIAQHRIRRFVGAGVTRWASRWFARNVAGFGGNITLGFLLGMTAVMGKFFGLPLDVRHVTLSTGALVLAVCSLGTQALGTPEFHAAAAGIAIIGVLNFGVSFALAFAVALRARTVNWPARFRLGSAIVGRMLRRPWEFVVPPSSGGGAHDTKPHH